MLETLKPLFTSRFLKFCVVGASGVVVNMGCLTLFARVMGIHANVAAALAIEVSIVTNFLVNEAWTFRDRRTSGALPSRMVRFHLVSLVGAALQWIVFVAANAVFATALGIPLAGAGGGWIERWIIHPVLTPPDVGSWMYLAQLAGIAVATFWNFFANFYWTWKHRREEVTDA